MNIENIKKEFPIFSNKVQNNDLVYLDSANSSQKPQIVIDRIYDFYTKEFSNVGRSVHYLQAAQIFMKTLGNQYRNILMQNLLMKLLPPKVQQKQ